VSPACTAQKSSSKVEKLIKQMTIEEKVGQMTQLNLDVVCEGEIYKLVEPHHIQQDKLDEAILKYHVGSILNCGGHAYPLAQWHEIISQIQTTATKKSRLQIPIVYGIDAIHGANYVLGSTLFPQQIGQAATFNPKLVQRGAEITAYETRAAGIPWNFSPVLDVYRTKSWSRSFETFGEDPFLCATMGKAMIRGYQGSSEIIDQDHVAACMKHFLGYSATRTGNDRTPAVITPIELREIYRPSFQAAIDEGALTVMINSGEINGIPVHANSEILIDLLRDEMGFKGVAVTDWEDVIKLQKNHRVAATLKDAVKMAVDAGIDMCMVPNDYDFTRLLIELVKEGEISEKRLDESVRRILTLKEKLGLFTNAFPPAQVSSSFASVEFQKSALKTAEESITLLKNNNGLLPLNGNQKILVVGEAAESMTLLNGAWTRTWQGTDSKWDDLTKNTIYEALQEYSSNVQYIQGATIQNTTNKSEAEFAASQADVIIVCVGETPSTEIPGNITDMNLSSSQKDLIRSMQQSGRPVVLVLLEARPLLLPDIEPGCSAVLQAYQPGDFGGEAIARIIFGEVNPSGKLPYTYPKFHLGTSTYDHKFTETFDVNFGHAGFQPQWEFGHGLSYSTIEYSNLSVSCEDEITVKVNVRNASNRTAKESVLLFVTDEVASVTPAVKKLKAFEKIELAPNEMKEVVFVLNKRDFEFIGADAEPVFEAGYFQIKIDQLSQRIELK
jgi:beta-glucosidase